MYTASYYKSPIAHPPMVPSFNTKKYLQFTDYNIITDPAGISSFPPSSPPPPDLPKFSSLFHIVLPSLTIDQVSPSTPPFDPGSQKTSDTTSKSSFLPSVESYLTSVSLRFLPYRIFKSTPSPLQDICPAINSLIVLSILANHMQTSRNFMTLLETIYASQLLPTYSFIHIFLVSPL